MWQIPALGRAPSQAGSADVEQYVVAPRAWTIQPRHAIPSHEGLHHRVVDEILGAVAVAGHRRRDRDETGVLAAVDLLEAPRDCDVAHGWRFHHGRVAPGGGRVARE